MSINKVFLYSLLIYPLIGNNNVSSLLSFQNNVRNELIITVEPQTHIDFGLSYPVTYELDIPHSSQNLNAYRKYNSSQSWDLINRKTSDDFFNGVEAVRFDYDEQKAYVSLGFSSLSDSIFIKLEDSDGNFVSSSIVGISEYYDNRRAVVTITADDWADYCHDKFIEACQNFRSYNLWLSVAIITGWTSGWNDIQTQLTLGLIEPVAHSRTHPYAPYDDVEGEVLGSKQDIIDNLYLLNHNRSGLNEYVYAWVAPFGDYDESIDTMTSNGKYLISRLFNYNEDDFSEWDTDLNKFDPVGGSIELGNSYYWGSTSINQLNNSFNNAYDLGKVYHLITHPNILDWNENFTWNHLEYISNRKDIWYVGFGHLYLYRLLSNSDHSSNLQFANFSSPPSMISLHKNYPNPFNPKTTISYSLVQNTFVNLTIYDLIGNEVKNLVNSKKQSGHQLIQWNATNNQGHSVPAGVYLYNIETDNFSLTKKMILLK